MLEVTSIDSSGCPLSTLNHNQTATQNGAHRIITIIIAEYHRLSD